MTVAMLERNLVRLYENFHSPDARARAQQPEEPAAAAAAPVSLCSMSWGWHLLS